MLKFEFEDNSPSGEYPKTLLIHNTKGGAVWQVYHIDNKYQASTIIRNAEDMGFMYITLEDYDPCEETFPNWREESARAYAKMFPEHLKLIEEEIVISDYKTFNEAPYGND